ncbi:MAG: hypothetical protein [Olavius algarvensis Delta 4 endosymbiont]|nr:MAG: hypothetical protein [Olavius algarvensis Delta 4 endosymbiont]
MTQGAAAVRSLVLRDFPLDLFLKGGRKVLEYIRYFENLF